MEGTFVGFTDGASHHTQNLASVSWVIYSPTSQLVVSGGAYLGPANNSVAEYNTVIELLCDAISNGILCLEVRLDSQLVVMQLNGEYRVCDPVILCYFLRVRLLERQFVFINYEHILRNKNTTANAFASYVLDWHLSHNITCKKIKLTSIATHVNMAHQKRLYIYIYINRVFRMKFCTSTKRIMIYIMMAL